MNESWKKEIARDILALGGLPFYIIAIVRMLIAPEFSILVPQLIISFIFLAIVYRLISFNQHLARGIVLFVFTSLGYKNIQYSIFASLLWIGMIFSLVELKEKKSEIITGIIVGVIITAIAHQLSNIFFG